jgi:hypothetical protein
VGASVPAPDSPSWSLPRPPPSEWSSAIVPDFTLL